MKPKFYEAGVFQVPAHTPEKGRNNASKHTGQPCPCRRSDSAALVSAAKEASKAPKQS